MYLYVKLSIFDLRIVLTVWYFFYSILELFRQCGNFLFDFRIVPTVWYFFLFYFRIIPAVWYFFYSILELFRQCGIFFI